MFHKKNILIIFLFFFFLAPYSLIYLGETLDPYKIDVSLIYTPPSLKFPFGTDSLGRNMLARIIYASGLSMKVTLHAFILSFIISLLIGGIAGLNHKKTVDYIILWVISLIYTVPFILIITAIFAVMNPSIEYTFIFISALMWSAPARLVRREVIQYRTNQFVIAERALGFSEKYIFFYTILPLSIMPALTSLLYTIPELISIEVGLSFFGLGVQPPTPTLGKLIYEGLSEFYTGWWLSLFPATVLFFIITLIYYLVSKVESRKILQTGVYSND